MTDYISFKEIESYKVRVRRLTEIELLGIDQTFKRFLNPVGIFLEVGKLKPKLIAVVDFNNIYDLNGNWFYND
jgi:hypothetical protein